MRHKLLFHFFCLIICASWNIGIAQPNYKIQFYTLEDGLSQGSVYSFYKDHLGYMWMSSHEGLNKFDGNNFQVYRDTRNDSTSIKGNNIVGIVQDPYNNIWVGSEVCLNKYIYDEDRFESIYIDDNNTRSDHYPFYADSSEVWYMSEDEGLVAYNFLTDSKEIIASELKYQRNYFIIKAALADIDHNIWIRTGKGIISINRKSKDKKSFYAGENIRCHTLDADSNLWIEYNSEDNRYSTLVKVDRITGNHHTYSLTMDIGSEVIDIAIQSDDRVWIGTAFNGLVLVDIINNKVVEKIDRNHPRINSLPTSSVSNLYYDSDSILWASNDPKGVFSIMEDDKPFGLISDFIIDNQEVRPGGFRSFYYLGNNKVLVGTEDEGISIFNSLTGKIEGRFLSSLYNNRHASSMLIDKNNFLWIGSYQGVTKIDLNRKAVDSYRNKFLETPGTSQLIWNIIEDYNGRVYYSTDHGVYAFANGITYQLPVYQSLPTGVIFIDNKNHLYIPNRGNGFASIHLDSLWKEGNINSKAAFHMHKYDITIKSFHQKGDDLWVGTTQGLIHFKFNKNRNKTSIIKQYGSDDGFPSNIIYGVLEDSEENLWMSSNRGLIKLNINNNHVSIYDPADGLQGYEYNTNTFCMLPSGMMLFGGVNGFNFFYPSKIKSVEAEYLPPHLYQLRFNDQSVLRLAEEEKTELSFDHNSFSIEYVSPYFNSTRGLSYEYSINNNEWKNAPSSSIPFYELSPGIYEIKIRVKPETTSTETPESQLMIKVLPPWYDTIWFKAFLSILALILFVTLLKWRFRTIRAREQLQSKIRTLKLDALQSQMNPHFIFNCLNTVDSYMARNEREKASAYLNEFAQLIRLALNNTKKEMIPLKDELAFIEKYVRMEQERFNPPFKFMLNLNNDEAFMHIMVPPLLIQPIVENAIWHGLSKSSNNGILEITDAQSESTYTLLVRDNGPGFDKNLIRHSDDPHGLQIIEDRISLYNKNSKISMDIQYSMDPMTTIQIHFKKKE